ncbi:MAG: GNAT family N-acetyltransferase [Cyanobacteriota bacterium]
MLVRHYRPSDAPALLRLLRETVRAVNSRDYSPAQIEAWAPESLDLALWARRCETHITLVAEAEGDILGFILLRRNGYLDCLYCHKHHQRRGVGGQLYEAAAGRALDLGLTRLWVEASITALPFFESMGFTGRQVQTVRRRGQTFLNYYLEKDLTGTHPNS